MKKFFLIFLISFVVLASCQKQKKQTGPLAYPVVKVVKQEVPFVKEFVGQTYGLFDISIRARADGFVKGIHFKEGSHVKKGQLLYTIDSAPFDAKVAEVEGKVAESKTRLAKAESDYARYKPLVETNAVSKSDFDAAVANLGAAKAGLEASEASLRFSRIQQGYTRIVSPIDGIIGRTEAKVSDYVGVAPNPVVLNTVSRIDTILVRFSFTETQFLAFQKARQVLDSLNLASLTDIMKIELLFSDGSKHPYPGKIDFVNRSVDPSTGTISVQASFPNPEQSVRPGLFAKMRMSLFIPIQSMLLPQKAIMEIQGRYNVFVVDAENKIEFRPIEVGDTYGDMWIVKSGLTGDEKVVLEGLTQVRSGMVIDPKETEFKSVRTPNN